MRAIATPPGEPTLQVALTTEEQTAFDTESAQNAAEQLESSRVAAIKEESDYRIAKLFGCPRPVDKIKLYEKELNGLMQNAELDNIVINGGTLTAEQQTLKNSFNAMKDTIKDIRAMSDLAEANQDTIETYIIALDAKGY